MAANHFVKWNDDDNILTAYCGDDTDLLRLGDVQWDDTQNRLEIFQDKTSTFHHTKWRDSNNTLEARPSADICICRIDNPGDCIGEFGFFDMELTGFSCVPDKIMNIFQLASCLYTGTNTLIQVNGRYEYTFGIGWRLLMFWPTLSTGWQAIATLDDFSECPPETGVFAAVGSGDCDGDTGFIEITKKPL